MTTDRDRATIEALKLALEQAAKTIEVIVLGEGCSVRANAPDFDRWLAMSAPDWSALPAELTGASGDA